MLIAFRDPNPDPNPDRGCGKVILRGLIEVITVGRTLAWRAVDLQTFFDRPGTSNGPKEAISGRLEHFRGSATGFSQLEQRHRPQFAGERRLQAPPTLSIAMSHQSFDELRQGRPKTDDISDRMRPPLSVRAGAQP
jgi:hypothetical protein